MSLDDKPILTLKISVTSFCRFQHFADFDFKIVALGENSSQLPYWGKKSRGKVTKFFASD